MFRYFGSKASTASKVADLALAELAPALSIADAFGGLGNIGTEFKKRGHNVTICDLLTFPHAFQYSRIVCNERPQFINLKNHLGLCNNEEVSDYLNTHKKISDWFVYEYSIKRHFFTESNAKKISNAWMHIRDWNLRNLVTEDELKFLIASLLNSTDAVANTAGTYYAYLKKWGRKPLKDFEFKWLTITDGSSKCEAIQGDAIDCLAGKSFDLLYLDPPYNSRDYSRYYHIPETLAQLKEVDIDSSSLSGLPLLRPDKGAQIRSAMKSTYLARLIESISWRRLVIQYAEGAYLSLDEITDLLNKYGKVETHKVQALGYQSRDGSRKQDHYVFIVNQQK